MGCTLAAYSEATGLPEEFLREAGVVEGTRRGAKVVKVPYRSAEGRELGAAVCVAPPEGDHLGEWTRKDDLGLYGLEALPARCDVWLVAGEVEAQTLRLHGIAALGLPATDGWRPNWTPCLEDVETIYAVASRGGDELVLPLWLLHASFRHRVELAPLGEDLTINALHRLTREQFPETWSALRASTVPASLVEHQQRQRRRSEALTRCAGLEAHADILDAFGDTLRRMGYAGDLRAAKLPYLVVTSRVLSNPVSAAVKGPSAAGKSFVVKQVLRFFPDEAYYAVTAMSDKALIYSAEPLEHRMLVLQEADGLSEIANLIVRSLLSEGRVRYDTVIDMQGYRIDRPGPTGLITTTTRVGLHPENETRVISITIPDDPDRIREVLRAVAREDDGDDVDLAPWHARGARVIRGQCDGPLRRCTG